LRRFKQKFDPTWSPEYLAISGRLNAARVLYEVSLLVSRGAKGMKKSRSQSDDVARKRSL
jgi:phosphatidylglycerol lysyltransferase